MPDTEEIDGDVYISPRYLAGSTAVGDPALEPLLALGFDLRHDDLGNAYVTAPDHRVRLGFLPEGEDDGLWRINAYRDRFGPPAWGVSFNDAAPTEFVTAFTTALAQAYTAGPDAYLAEPDLKDPELGAFDAVVPLIKNGWQFQPPRWNVLQLQPPDGLATCEYTTGRLDPEKELTTLQARWHLWGGPKSGYAHWYATATTHTPIPLVKAITQSVCDPAPLPRWTDAMSSRLREVVQLTPVAPPAPAPAPPAPTPLDVRRGMASRRPAVRPAASVPRWSTTTRSAVPGPRR